MIPFYGGEAVMEHGYYLQEAEFLLSAEPSATFVIYTGSPDNISDSVSLPVTVGRVAWAGP